jgi:hypothetical protein
LGESSATIGIVAPQARRPTISLTPAQVYAPVPSSSSNVVLDVLPILHTYYIRCRVTDSFGNSALSNSCKVVFQYT